MAIRGDDRTEKVIEHINELSATARTTWLALLALLAFIGITLLAVEVADFFVASRRTDLPLVNNLSRPSWGPPRPSRHYFGGQQRRKCGKPRLRTETLSSGLSWSEIPGPATSSI